MPFPDRCWRAQLEGQLSNNLDIWNMVWHIDPHSVDFATYGQEMADGVRDAVQTNLFSPTVNAGLYHETTFSQVTLYELDNTGHAIGQVLSSSDPTVYHGAGDSALPTECACVASLLTGRPGRSYRGRSYLPGLDFAALDDHGFITAAAQLLFATAVADSFGSINAVFGSLGSVAPRVGVLSTKLGVVTPITAVKVGNIVDVQRRRRNGQPEGYVNANVPT